MAEILAQGDLLFERVFDVIAPVGLPAGEPVVLAEGETTGHRHMVWDRVAFFRDDGLARDIPDGLYVGHLQVADGLARVQHEEHAPIDLGQGVWRVRRQRELEPKDVRIVRD